MRIYTNLTDMAREVERDLGEMGIEVHPQSMQDKDISGDSLYLTKELQAYGFQLAGWEWNATEETNFVNYMLSGDMGAEADHRLDSIMNYIAVEHEDRLGEPRNPGRSWKYRADVWEEFLHDGKFAYTYSERIHPQLETVAEQLHKNPDTRQAIVNFHSNISPIMTADQYSKCNFEEMKNGETLADYCKSPVQRSVDLRNIGGTGRIPCSMFYQFMRRNKKLDLIYHMRSCDFLSHFMVDIALALRMQRDMAQDLGIPTGTFTYFAGSLHAYAKDVADREIF